MSSFKVSIINGQVILLCEDEIPETDIIDLLTFDESQIEDLYRDHAAIQARWEQIAINLRNQYELFCDEFEKKWWAHNKTYAKLVLEGYGDKKPTIDTIKDQVILMYSEEVSDISVDKFCEIAYSTISKKSPISKDDFKKEMFKYLFSTPKWTYEALVRTVRTLEKSMLTIQNVAKRLDNRSYHLKDLKDLVMAKRFNIGSVSEKDTLKVMSSFRQ